MLSQSLITTGIRSDRIHQLIKKGLSIILYINEFWQHVPWAILAMGKFYNGTYWAKSTFCRVETNSIMFMHTRLVSPPKLFAKFLCQTQTFCNKKGGNNGQPSFDQTDYSRNSLLVYSPFMPRVHLKRKHLNGKILLKTTYLTYFRNYSLI